MDAAIGPNTLIGDRWRISQLVGKGGFGQVFEAVDASDISLGSAAVKVLHPNTSPQERQEFLGEVQKIAVLRHQNLVGYLDSGLQELGGQVHPYLVTELCMGSLSDHLDRSGALSADETLAILTDITAGLAHLHGRQLIHRDIKPGNVLYADGGWKLADFGLMRDLSATGSYHRGELFFGTPAFMAPELFTTNMATAPSDVYAVGVLAHLCATGQPLHTGTGPALVHNIMNSPPQINPVVDSRLQGLIGHATHPDPTQRPSAVELSRRIQSTLDQLTGPTFPNPVALPQYKTAAPPAVTDFTALPPPPASLASVPEPKSRTDRSVAIGLLGLLILLSTVGVLILARSDSPTNTERVVEAAEPRTTSTEIAGPPPQPAPTQQDPVSTIAIPARTIAETSEDSLGASADHLVGPPPCADGGPVDQVQVTNAGSVPVDYAVEVHHHDAAGVRIEVSFDRVKALPPGQSALLDLAPFEEAALTCELARIEIEKSNAEAVAAIAQAAVTSCVLDTFFGNLFDLTLTMTNPSDVPVDATVSTAVIDANGLRIDDSIGAENFYDIGPGESVRESSKPVYWNMDNVEQPVTECIVTSVEITPS